MYCFYENIQRFLLATVLLVAGPFLGESISFARDMPKGAVNNPQVCKDVWGPVGLPDVHKDAAHELGTRERDRLIDEIENATHLFENSPAGTGKRKAKRALNKLMKRQSKLKAERDNFETSAPYYYICREHFFARYNVFNKSPDYVIEKLNREITEGAFTRPHIGFSPDPILKEEFPAAIDRDHDKDYASSKLDRGHLGASADFKSNLDWMRETFVFSNAVPQVGVGFNRGIWREFEALVQNYAKTLRDDDAIYVITGPVDMSEDGKEIEINAEINSCGNEITLAGLGTLKKKTICDANDKDPTQSCDHGVAVPSGLFKLIYSPHRGGRVFGYVLSNEKHLNGTQRGVSAEVYLDRWRASIDMIEAVSGIDFFPNKTRRWANIHESQCAVKQWRQ